MSSPKTPSPLRQLVVSIPPVPLLVVAWTMTAGWILLPDGLVSDVVYLAVSAVAAAASWAAVPLTTSATRSAARFVAAGLTLTAIADVIWSAIEWSGSDPDPSVADIYYLAGYGMLGAAVVVLLMPLRGKRRIVDGDAVVDILTIVTVCVVVLWELAIRDTALDGSVGDAVAHTELIYPLVDAVLIGLVVRAMTDRYVRSVLGLGFGLGTVCWLLGDFTYLAREQGGLFQDLTSLTWMVGTLLLATSTLRLRRERAQVAGPQRDRSSVAGRLVVAVAPLSVPPLLVIVESAIGRDPESWSLVIGIMVLIALAFVRTERSLATERRIRRELAITRDAALEASRAKSTFLAGISHEIRTPMNGVLGLSRLLDATDLDEDQRQYTEGIQRAGDALMTLLNQVLDFAKFEDGRVEVDAIDFDVLAVVEDVAAMVAEPAHHHGVELVASCAPDLPRALNGDPTKLRQVLLNLASNAVKFTAEGEVAIRAGLERAPGASVRPEVVVRFEVRDTGIGIAEADRDRLFEAFTQAEDSQRTHGGSGLGLAIASSLVEAMGGEIGVRSEPGRGSTFWCTVPLRPARQQQVVETRPSRAAPGTRVLVVDDNPTSRVVLHDLLTAWEMEVHLAGSGATAVEMVASAAASGTPYALVVADLRMPRMDGLALAERVRRDPATARTPIVVLTSGPEVPAANLRRAGVEVSVAKPVQLSRLQGAIQRALGAGTPVVRPSDQPVPMGRGVVLVVDDSEVNQMVAVGTLRQLGYLTEVAADGAQAVAMVASTSYDAVLMDCRMPVLDGYEAAAAIRARELGRRVPIIAVTASAVAGDRERCLAAGMDDYLVKPLGRQQLDETLARWIPAPGRSLPAPPRAAAAGSTGLVERE